MYRFGHEARDSMMKGIELMRNCVTATLGPNGRNVAIDRYMINDITKDGVTVLADVVADEPFAEMGCKMVREASTKTNDEAGDGPQPLSSKILTPKGFIKMGDIKVGDDVCGTNGSTQKVLGVYPKGQKEIYEVRMTDGRMAECCEDHFWSVITRYGKRKIVTAKQLSGDLRAILTNGDIRHRFYLPRNKVEFTEDPDAINLDPYFLGVLLGDGSITGSGSFELSLGIEKEHILEKLRLPDGVTFSKTFIEKKNYFRVKFSGTAILRESLKSLGLYEKNSHTKFIPECYLYSSTETRLSLLQGLLDTDGHINGRGLFEFSTVSAQLALDFSALCSGLGMSLYTRLHTRENDSGSYSNNPIYRIMKLKGDMYGHSIDSIEPTGKFTDMQCIKVSNPDNLYITDGYLVTHNTTTAIEIAWAICEAGRKKVAEGTNVIKLQCGIQKGMDAVVARLEKMAVPMNNDRQKYVDVATISSQDTVIGYKVAEIFLESGENGVIEVERVDEPGITTEHTDGMQILEGWLRWEFINDHANLSFSMEDVPVIVTDREITSIPELNIIDLLARKGIKKALIICDDCNGEALGTLVKNARYGAFHACVIKAPAWGARKMEILKDICAMTGATLISEESGSNLMEANISVVGYVRQVTVKQKKTVLIADKERKVLNPITGEEKTVAAMIEERVAQLKSQAEEAEEGYEKEKLRERLANLTDGVSLIKLGANTEIERILMKRRVEDAVRAVQCAKEGGVVIGGGAALLKCVEDLEELRLADPDEQMGIDIVIEAIHSPARRILEVAGTEPESAPFYYRFFKSIRRKWTVKCQNKIIEEVKRSGYLTGYDMSEQGYTYTNLMTRGVIDPVKVVKSAFLNGASCAKTFLSVEVCITPIPETDPLLKKKI